MADTRKQADSLRSIYQDVAIDMSANGVKKPQGRRTAMESATTPAEPVDSQPLETPSASGNLKASNQRVQAAAAAETKAGPTRAKPAAGDSMKHKPATTLEEDIAAYKQDLSEIDVDSMYIDLNCNQVRSRINKVIDSGIMKKGEFCDAIGSSNNSVSTLLKKRQRAEADFAAASDGVTAGPAAKKAKTTAGASAMIDLSAIHLDGEETDSVLVFDSCDEIRKKISAHLKTPGLTQAQFCRGLYAQLGAPTCKAIQTKQLNDFRGKKGAISGCTSSVFYAAYVYLEKLRIAKRKPKSAHRLEMESIYPGEGINRENDGRHG